MYEYRLKLLLIFVIAALIIDVKGHEWHERYLRWRRQRRSS